MICPPQGNQYCPDGLVVFADCGLNPTYTSEGLGRLRHRYGEIRARNRRDRAEGRHAFLLHKGQRQAR